MCVRFRSEYVIPSGVRSALPNPDLHPTRRHWTRPAIHRRIRHADPVAPRALPVEHQPVKVLAHAGLGHARIAPATVQFQRVVLKVEQLRRERDAIVHKLPALAAGHHHAGFAGLHVELAGGGVIV